jgi:tripartite-type tricarboxylate transporter receptor subunit TctC
MNSNRSRLSRISSVIATVVATFIVALPASAQYPDKPVRIIVPWAAGASTDAIARTLAQRLSETMKQSFIVENRPGAAAAIGTGEMAKAAPDGYTLGIIELAHAIAPSVVAKLPYDLQRDLQAVVMIGTSPLVLFTNSAVAAKNVNELVALAKAAPGTIAIAHSGNGTSSHLAAELLQQKTGAKFNLASYKGSGPALLDVAGGHVQGHFATMASGGGLMKTGKVNAYGVAGAQRINAIKDTPTFTEANIKDLIVEQWWGVVVPKATPAAIVERLNSEVAAAIKHPQMQERMRELAIEARYLPSSQFTNFIDAEVKRWGAVVKEAGIRPE